MKKILKFTRLRRVGAVFDPADQVISLSDMDVIGSVLTAALLNINDQLTVKSILADSFVSKVGTELGWDQNRRLIHEYAQVSSVLEALVFDYPERLLAMLNDPHDPPRVNANTTKVLHHCMKHTLRLKERGVTFHELYGDTKIVMPLLTSDELSGMRREDVYAIPGIHIHQSMPETQLTEQILFGEIETEAIQSSVKELREHAKTLSKSHPTKSDAIVKLSDALELKLTTYLHSDIKQDPLCGLRCRLEMITALKKAENSIDLERHPNLRRCVNVLTTLIFPVGLVKYAFTREFYFFGKTKTRGMADKLQQALEQPRLTC